MRQGDILEFAKEHDMWSGTVGPKEALYLPPGCIVSENVMKSDVLGIRFGFNVLGKQHDALDSAIVLHKALQPASIPSPLFAQYLKDAEALKDTAQKLVSGAAFAADVQDVGATNTEVRRVKPASREQQQQITSGAPSDQQTEDKK